MQWFQRHKPIVKIVLVAASLLVFCGCVAPSLGDPPNQPTATETRPPPTEALFPTLSPETQSPTQTQPIEQNAAPTEPVEPAATGGSPALLPGLDPDDVTVNLEERGFECTPVVQGQPYYVRYCDRQTADYSFNVQIFGRESFSIDYIDSTLVQISNPDAAIVAEFLGFMATMPYDNATPEEARTWVETTLPTLQGEADLREQTFAGVKYQLYEIPTAITLTMGDLP